MSDGWSTGTAAPHVKPLSPGAQAALGKYGSEDALLLAWTTAKSNLDVAKEIEAALRVVVFEIKFPDPKEGTQRAAIGNAGWNIKATWPQNYNLDKERTEAVQNSMCELGVKQELIADRLIKWTPELSIKEYRLLEKDTTSEGMQLRMMLSSVLEIKPGMPQLEIEKPKAA